MQRLIASTPQAEVSTVSVLSLINNIQSEEIVPIMNKKGLIVDPNKLDGWYKHQQILDIYRAIQEEPDNITENFVSIGMKIMEQAPFPPNMQTIEEALASLGITYQMAHRNHTEAGWVTEFIGKNKALITADNPYPDDLCYGLLWALVKRFAPKGSNFIVAPLPLGGEPHAPVKYEVTW